VIFSIAGFIYTNKLIKKFIQKLGTSKNVPTQRVLYLENFFTLMLVLGFVIVFSLIFSIDYKGLLVFASSVFAVVGVALFAQWSILSNVTSSIIIFFSFPAKIGDKIKTLDGDNSITGTITKITLFQVELEDENGNQVIYPNNLLLQKPVVKILQNED
jgi:small-conductance mechanosensitive channel